MKSPPRATVTGTNHHAPPTPAATNNNGNQDTSQFILQTILQLTEPMMRQMQATAERLAQVTERLQEKAANPPPESRPRTTTRQLEPDLHGARDRPIQYNQGATPNGGEDEVPRGPNGEILINQHNPLVRIGQVDSSKDDKDKIHGLSIFDSQVDRAMMPEALLRSQYNKGLYDVTNDIASLPGTCSPKGGGGDVDVNTDTTDIMQQFLETVESSKSPSMKTTITAIHYPKTSRHGLSLIKSKADLFKAASTIAEDKELTSRNQQLRIQSYLHDRGYMKGFIDNYLERSLLCLIIQETLTNYTALINKIRQKRIDGMSDVWKGSEAYLLLSHHSKELLRIRVHSTSKRLFQNYIYLRDAQAKNFNSNKITEKTITNVREENRLFQEALDSRLEALVEERLAEHLAKNKKGAGKGNDEPKCSWCHNRDLHIALGIKHTPKACPLKSHPTTWAKKACRKVLQTYKADPKRPIAAEIVKEVLEGWKKE
ncbi:unnamed protein product [Cylindrotheca closterium]|uniref:Uncharacterized protein n=1 Tax=Cylindrotheca closterium TaxID=2856 RepID=A0AAD2FUK7_9STRA|nr:unnamed protein product [Cylindrotheca closterium]